MKWNSFIIIYLLTSGFLSAQLYEFTYSTNTDGSDNKYGKLIMETPFGARLYKNPYFTAQELLDNIKNQCKGKAIFIDFWATWCRPCIEQMPKTKRLYIETKNLPIEFIYICNNYGTTTDEWITRISYLKQPGNHLFVEDETVNGIFKLLETGGGYPSYIYFDENGEFKPDAIPRNACTTTEILKGLIKKY